MNTKTQWTSVAAFSVAALLTTSALAGPDRSPEPAKQAAYDRVHHLTKPAAVQTAPEPDRIFNTMTRQFEPNPDYRDPLAQLRKTRVSKPAGEPDRIFNTITKQFEPNPAYRDPLAQQRPTHVAKVTGEPRRIYDLESGNFVPNPDYHGPDAYR